MTKRQRPLLDVSLSNAEREELRHKVIAAVETNAREFTRKRDEYLTWWQEVSRGFIAESPPRNSSQRVTQSFNERLLWSGWAALNRACTFYQQSQELLEFIRMHSGSEAARRAVSPFNLMHAVGRVIRDYVDWIQDTINKRKGPAVFKTAPPFFEAYSHFSEAFDSLAAYSDDLTKRLNQITTERKRNFRSPPEARPDILSFHLSQLPIRNLRLTLAFVARESRWLLRAHSDFTRRDEAKAGPALTGSERVKRARERKRRGVVHRVSVDVYAHDLDVMKDLNLIRAADIDDRDAIEDAVASLFTVSLWTLETGSAQPPPAKQAKGKYK